MCIHFLYSVTIYNDSAFYFTEIIVLISWEGTPTQIRVREVASHSTLVGGGGEWMRWGRFVIGQYVFFMSIS